MTDNQARKLGELFGAVIVIALLGLFLAFVAWLTSTILQAIGVSLVAWFAAGVLIVAIINIVKHIQQRKTNA